MAFENVAEENNRLTCRNAGGSSGIGLATVDLLLSLGASVVNGDLQAPAKLPETEAYKFVKTNVTSWSDLNNLFKEAKKHYGRVDSALANAGIAPLGIVPFLSSPNRAIHTG